MKKETTRKQETVTGVCPPYKMKKAVSYYKDQYLNLHVHSFLHDTH